MGEFSCTAFTCLPCRGLIVVVIVVVYQIFVVDGFPVHILTQLGLALTYDVFPLCLAPFTRPEAIEINYSCDLIRKKEEKILILFAN